MLCSILFTFVGLSRTSLIQLLLTNDARPPAEVPPPRSDPRIVGYRPLALHRDSSSLLCACLASSLALCKLFLGSESRRLPYRSTNHGAAWLADRDCRGWYHRCELCGDGTHRSALPLLVTIASYGTRFVVCDIRACRLQEALPSPSFLTPCDYRMLQSQAKQQALLVILETVQRSLLRRLSPPFFPPLISPSHRSFVVRGWLCAPDIRAIDVNLYLPYLAPSAKM